MPTDLPWTRRRFLTVTAGGLAGAALLGNLGTDLVRPRLAPAEKGLRRYLSRPDLVPPTVTITTPAAGTTPGLVFLTPAGGVAHRGALVVDDTGALVWFRRAQAPAELAIDLRVQRYRGQPVLTWWEGNIDYRFGVGSGEFVIADSGYREIARVRADGPTPADQHEFLLTPEGTALFFAYPTVPSAVGPVYDCVLQEVDVATGKAVFTWSAVAHVDLSESYVPPPAGTPYDYFHANSIDVDTDGHLLVSARHTWTIYKIHRRTGQVLWRLGGKQSDFTLPPGTGFSWQHDARRRDDGHLSLFDNGAGVPGIGVNATRSQGLVLEVNERTHTVRLVAAYPDPHGGLSPTQGACQELPDGGVFVGWGQQPFFTEFTAGGAVRFEGRLPTDITSYRAYRFPWTGRPVDTPTMAVQTRESGAQTVHASWNGATEVSLWRVRAGQTLSELVEVATQPRAGFETAVRLAGAYPYLVVDALDRDGAVLATSAPRAAGAV